MNLNNLSFEQKQTYYEALCEMISPERVRLSEKIIEERTDSLDKVLDYLSEYLVITKDLILVNKAGDHSP